MHKNFFTFSADTHFDLGKQMGITFKKEAQNALANINNSDLEKRIETGRKMLQETEKHFPEYIEEVKGYAEGAGIEFPKMWVMAIEGDADIELGRAKCTSIITNNGKLMVHSEDTEGPGMENDICVVKKIINDLTTLEIYYYNTLGGVSVGLNSNGYAISLNTILDKPSQIGIPKGVVGRKFLDTKDPSNDYEKIKNMKLADGYNHNILDTKGNITNIELSINESDISYPSSPFSHTNHCLILKNIIKTDDEYGTFSRLEKALTTPANISIENLKKIVEDNSLGKSLSINNERTIGRMIVDFESFNCHIWLLREDELGWVTYPIDFIKK